MANCIMRRTIDPAKHGTGLSRTDGEPMKLADIFRCSATSFWELVSGAIQSQVSIC